MPQWPGPFQFVTGPAGSGKTTLVRGWREHDPGFLLCATTGIAAVNLGGDVVTLHSTLRFSTTDVLEQMFVDGFLQARMRKLRAAGVTRYGIDEVSMLGARPLTILTNAVEELNSEAAVLMGHEPPTGITLIGDFLQLPPVGDEDPAHPRRKKKVEYAFESAVWEKYEAHTRTLAGTHRQHDAQFIRALRAARVGDGDTVVEILRDHIQPTVDRGFPGVTILGLNIQVDRYNKLQQTLLSGKAVRFSNRTTGEPLREWMRHIPVFAEYKIGSRVMVLANKYMTVAGNERVLVYANGDCGILVDGNPAAKWADVRLNRTGEVVRVTYNVRQNLKPTGHKGKKKDAYEVLGEIEYMPLRLADASSVHKCVAGDTRVPVRNRGLLPIRDVQPGYEVYTGCRWSRVRAVAATEHDAYRVTTRRGYTVVASADHRWPISADTQAPTSRLAGTELLLSARVPEDAGTCELSTDVAWWLGATLGDGNTTDRHQGAFHFTNACAAVRDRWMRVAQQLGGRPNTRRDKRGCHLTSKPVRLQLELWGVGYEKSPQKTVPAVIWRSGPSAWRAFLQGVFDTDGGVRGMTRGVTYCTKSVRLGEEVQQLLLLLGIGTHRGRYTAAAGPYFQVHVATEMVERFRAEVGFFHPERAAALARLRSTPRQVRWNGLDAVAAVEPLRLTIPMYDLEVEDASHLVCFNGIVGSNSQGLTLDHVQVDISDRFFAAPAMTYVALSRARSLEGLRIVGNPDLLRRRCTVDSKVERWR